VIEIKFTIPDYTLLLQQIASALKSPVKANAMAIPLGYGNGWIWSEKLPSGITILVADTKLNKDLLFTREAIEEQHYSLQFNEIYVETKREGKTFETLVQSFIKLHQSTENASFSLLAGIRIKTLKFYFNKKQMAQLMDEDSLKRLFNYQLPNYLALEKAEIIDVHYRSILDELLVPSIDQPLRINFIQNRILLLLENFINLQQNAKVIPLKNKLNSSDLERLMQAESLLLKDYGTAPPTIERLSKICAMSATKLKNEFKCLYGVPIYEYYPKNRMARAKALLLEGQYTCKEVGVRIGYSNLSHFAASFKKEFGISPSELLDKHIKMIYAV
jgi:AraC-like DNA-binding protein